MPKVDINTTAPDFSLETLDGSEIKLSEFRSKKNVLLVFNRGFM